MKCPLRQEPEFDKEGEAHFQNSECLKKECGFWSHSSNGCALPIIAEELHWISDRLSAIATKLPGKAVL